MNTPPRSILATLGTLAAMCLLLIVLANCSRQSGEPAIYTGRIYSAEQVRELCGWAFLGKATYAEVNRDWLPWYYAQFRSEIAAGAYGVVKWQPDAACTFFASRFASGSQLRFFAQNWNTGLATHGIAVGKRWYTQVGGKTAHALIQAITQNGLEFFEPQTGQFVTLAGTELTATQLSEFD